MIERQVGIHLLQAPILGLELLEPSQIRRFQAAVLRAPLVERGIADTELPADILHCDALFGPPMICSSLYLLLRMMTSWSGPPSCRNSSYARADFKGRGQADPNADYARREKDNADSNGEFSFHAANIPESSAYAPITCTFTRYLSEAHYA